jgi:hypothetical protein
MRAQHTRRIVASFAVMMLLGSIAVLLPARSAQADVVNEWLTRVNGLRSSLGLTPLQLDGEQSGLAQRRAEINAAADKLAHEPDLTAGVSENWTKLGENVGTGPSVDLIWDAFLKSPKHYANLSDPAFTHIGVGVAYQGTKQYVTHRFMALGAAPAVSAGGGSGSGRVTPPPTTPPPTVRVTPTVPVTAPITVPVTVAEPVAPPTTLPPAEPASVSAVLDALHFLER